MSIEKERTLIAPDYDDPIFDGDKKEIERLTRDNEQLRKIANTYGGEGFNLSPADVLDEVKAQNEINSIVEEYPELNLKEVVETRTKEPYSNPPSIILSELAKKTGKKLYGNYGK